VRAGVFGVKVAVHWIHRSDQETIVHFDLEICLNGLEILVLLEQLLLLPPVSVFAPPTCVAVEVQVEHISRGYQFLAEAVVIQA